MPTIKFDSRRGKSVGTMGRFGGGWNYVAGIQLSGFKRPGTLIVNLFVCSIRIGF